MNPQNNENGNRSKDKPKSNLFLFVSTVVVISAWTFFLGIMVGRDMAPVKFDIEKLQKQIEELKKEIMEREKQLATSKQGQSTSYETNLGFYDALREEDDSDPLDSVFPEPENEQDAEQENQDPLNTSPEKKVSEVSPEKVPEPKKKPDAQSSEKTLKNYSIQVASSKDPKEADKLVEKYKKKGYPAYRASVEIKNAGVWHRVRIGPFKAYSEAQRILGILKKEKSGALILEH